MPKHPWLLFLYTITVCSFLPSAYAAGYSSVRQSGMLLAQAENSADDARAIKKKKTRRDASKVADIAEVVNKLNTGKIEDKKYFKDLNQYGELVDNKKYPEAAELAAGQFQAAKSRNDKFLWQAFEGLAYAAKDKKEQAQKLMISAVCRTGHIKELAQQKCENASVAEPLSLNLFEYDLLIATLATISSLQWRTNDIYGAVATDEILSKSITVHLRNPKDLIEGNYAVDEYNDTHLQNFLKSTCSGLGMNPFEMFLSQAQFATLNAVEKQRGSKMALYDFTDSSFLERYTDHKQRALAVQQQLKANDLSRPVLRKISEYITENALAKMKVGVTIRNMLLSGSGNLEQYEYLIKLDDLDSNPQGKDNRVRLYRNYAARLLDSGEKDKAIQALRTGVEIIDTYDLVQDSADVLHWTRTVADLAELLGNSDAAKQEIDKAIARVMDGHDRYAAIYSELLQYKPSAVHTHLGVLITIPARKGIMAGSIIRRLEFHNKHRLFELGVAEMYLRLGNVATAKKWLDKDIKTSTQDGYQYSVYVRAFESYIRAKYSQAVKKYQAASEQYAEAVRAWYSSPQTIFDSLQGVFSYRSELIDAAIEFEYQHGSKIRALDYIELSRSISIDALNVFALTTQAALEEQLQVFIGDFDNVVQSSRKSADAKNELEGFEEKLAKVNFDYHAISPENNFADLLIAKRGALVKILNTISPWVDYSLTQKAVDDFFAIESSVNLTNLKTIRSKALKKEYAQYIDKQNAGLAKHDKESYAAEDKKLFGFLYDLPVGEFDSVGVGRRRTSAQIQKLIPAKESLLSYWLTRNNLYIFQLNSDGIASHVIARDTVEPQITEALENYDSQSARALYEQLIAPVLAGLGERVVIASNGVLQQLPFAALQSNTGYFGDQHLIRHTPTLSQAIVSKLKPTNKGVLVMAPTTVPGTPELAGARAEVKEIQQIMKVDLASDRKVTRSFFMEQLPNFGMIHFAGHGQLNSDFPDYSKLVVYDDNGGRAAVFVEDIKNLNLSGVEMVVLSACESGITQAGDINNEFSSLGAAFLSAGTQAVVSSLREVSDAATKTLMMAFYKNIAKGLPKDRSLQLAQIAVRESLNAQNTPVRADEWATFTLWGSPRAIQYLN